MGRARAACALALFTALTVLASTLLSPLPASAHPTQTPAESYAGVAQASVSLTQIAPTVARPGDRLTIRGLLDLTTLGIETDAAGGSDTSTPTTSPTAPSQPTETAMASEGQDSLEPAAVATVQVRIGADRLSDDLAVQRWQQSDAPGVGATVGQFELIPPFAAGEDGVPFAVTLDDLGPHFGRNYGVLPLTVQVIPAGSSTPSGEARTMVPYEVVKEYVPLGLSLVVPFTVPADTTLLADFSEERTAAWEALLGPQSALRQRLEGASDPRITWVIDPALLFPGLTPEDLLTPDEAAEPEETAPTGPATATNTDTPTNTTPTETDAATQTDTATQTDAAATQTNAPTTGATGESPADATQSPTDTDEQTPGETTDPGAVPGETPAMAERRIRMEFATELLERARDRDVLVLPTYDADVAALSELNTQGSRSASGLREILTPLFNTSAAQEVLRTHGARPVPAVAPASGRWSAPMDAALQDVTQNAATDSAATAEPWRVLIHPLSNAAADPTTSDGYASASGPTAAGSLALTFDPNLTVPVTADPGEAALPQITGTLAAQTLFTLNERPGTARHRIALFTGHTIDPSLSDDVAAMVDDIPWLTLEPLPGPGSELASEVTLVDTIEYDGAGPVLANADADSFVATVRRLPTAASVLPGVGADLSTRGAESLSELTSQRWREGFGEGNEDWTLAYDPIKTTVAQTFTGLTIPARDITFLADSGVLRITVENGLDLGISNAVLELTSDHPILQIESEPQVLEVGPGSRSTMAFNAAASASGRATLTATIRAPDGTVLGEPTSFDVRVSPTSEWIFWVLGAVAGIVLIIGIVRTLRRRGPSV